jgi:signal transduction histidine kinase
MRRTDAPFRPRARLLELLGDQLIRDANVALFELVKNSYDADASTVTVTMRQIGDSAETTISIEDDGSGMDFDTVRDVWLEPGTAFRSEQKRAGERSARFGRLPMGEKGVGRFAAHKLGEHVRMITRKARSPEVVVNIDWTKLGESRYLDEAKVRIQEREPQIFVKRNTGTRIEISRVRSSWTRAMVREAHRAITAIRSPFHGPADFDARLVLDPDEGWLAGLMRPEEVLDLALFKVTGTITGDRFSYFYQFRPYARMGKVEARSQRVRGVLPAISIESDRRDERVPDIGRFEIGAIKLDLYIFDRDPQVLELGVSDKKGLKEFLDTNGGIRVYRDGIRVYDYGERGTDWLELDAGRFNFPTQRIINNLFVGSASLTLEDSRDLTEKTNREGFVENSAFRELRAALQSAIRQVAAERNVDKERIRRAYGGRKAAPVLETIAEIKEHLEAGDTANALKSLDRLGQEYLEMRDRLLTAAGAGLTLVTVIHEVEKGIAELARAVERGAPRERIEALALHLEEVVTGLTFLTRRSGRTTESAETLVKQALFNVEFRLKHHRVRVENGFDTAEDFRVRCTRRLIIAALMNLIDNSIYWTGVRWHQAPERRRLFVGPGAVASRPALVVADNGPGFQDDPSLLTEAFISRRPDGMGLGLHIAKQVMESHGGHVAFPSAADVGLSDEYDGAVVALVFEAEK